MITINDYYSRTLKLCWFSNLRSQFLIVKCAVSYLAGNGVARDYVSAYVWFALAAAQFQPGKKKNDTTRNRDLAAEQLTPEQLADAKRIVEDWKPKPER